MPMLLSPLIIAYCDKLCSYKNRYLFFALKINHESHEFILDPGTVMNTIIRDHAGSKNKCRKRNSTIWFF